MLFILVFPSFSQNRVKITFIFKNRIANICILSSINNRDNQGSSRVSIRVNKKETCHYFWYSNTHTSTINDNWIGDETSFDSIK